MTNKEIMQASLLDIVFDNRNKAYGAYALRREYPNRLLIALGAALSIVLLFWVLSSLVFVKEEIAHNPIDDKTITVTIIPPDFIEPPPLPTQPPVQTAQSDYQEILIVPDPEVTQSLPTIDDLTTNAISNINIIGPPPTGIVTISDNPVSNTGNVQPEILRPEPELIFSKTEPQYPGGQDALIRFLQTNLITPDELEAGDQKTVQVRFKINEQGALSDLEITKSGGEAFDKEVIRVFKKMKRWKPATQNGSNVSISFVMPVTFIAYEQ